MDKRELKSLEEKARSIVSTLSELEQETNRQKEMGDQLEQSKQALLAVESRLSAASERIADALSLLQQSTFAEDLNRLDSKIEDIGNLAALAKDEAKTAEGLCRKTTDLASSVEATARQVDNRLAGIHESCKELLRLLEDVSEQSAQRDDEFTRRLDAFEEVIGRIDRNTQKGFGKERAKHAAW